jgi:hypothetical protein
MRIKKKRVDEIHPTAIVEFELTPSQRKQFLHGIELFNAQKFWEAHEAWEEVWKERIEDARIFLQGLIQAAAALHLIVGGSRIGGAKRNFYKSVAKLSLFPPHFLGINVQQFREDISNCVGLLADTGSNDNENHQAKDLPKLFFSFSELSQTS